MKRIIYIAATLFSLFMLSGCNGEPEEIVVDPTVFKLATIMARESADPHSSTYAVTCDQKISAKLTDESWAKIEAVDAGSDNTYKITVSFKINDTEDDRTVTVVVTSGSQEKRITIKQSGLGSIADSRSLVFRGIETKELTLTTKSDWTLELSDTKGAPEWLKASATSGKAGESTISFSTTEENLNMEDRNCWVKVNLGGSMFFITVTQVKTDAIIADTHKKEVGIEGGLVTIEVASNVEYEVSVSNGWIKQVEAPTKGLESTTYYFEVEKNDELDFREGQITFANREIEDYVTIFQAASEKIILAKSEINVPSYAAETSVSIRANVEYTLSCDAEWLSASTSENLVDEVILSVEANTQPQQRVAHVTVRSTYSDLSETLTVIQAGFDAESPFESDTYGVFNYNANGDCIEFDKYAFQIAFRSGMFRIVDPNMDKIVELSDIPGGEFSEGDTLHLRVIQNWTSAFPHNSVRTMKVYKTKGDIVWAIDASGIGYTFRK